MILSLITHSLNPVNESNIRSLNQNHLSGAA